MQPQNPSPSDYLNQIASPPPKAGMSNRLFLIIIASAVVLILITVIAMFASGGSKGITTEQLGLRLQALQKTSADAQKNIKDSQLRAINSRLTTYLTDTNRDIAEPLQKSKIDLKKASKSLLDSEKKYIDELSTLLDDARLNDEFDSTYSREMAYELNSVIIMTKALQKKTTSKSMKEFLGKAPANLESLQQELQDYDSL